MHYPPITHIGYVIFQGKIVQPGLIFTSEQQALDWASGKHNHLVGVDSAINYVDAEIEPDKDAIRVVRQVDRADLGMPQVAEPVPATHTFVAWRGLAEPNPLVSLAVPGSPADDFASQREMGPMD